MYVYINTNTVIYHKKIFGSNIDCKQKRFFETGMSVQKQEPIWLLIWRVQRLFKPMDILMCDNSKHTSSMSRVRTAAAGGRSGAPGDSCPRGSRAPPTRPAAWSARRTHPAPPPLALDKSNTASCLCINWQYGIHLKKPTLECLLVNQFKRTDLQFLDWECFATSG